MPQDWKVVSQTPATSDANGWRVIAQSPAAQSGWDIVAQTPAQGTPIHDTATIGPHTPSLWERAKGLFSGIPAFNRDAFETAAQTNAPAPPMQFLSPAAAMTPVEREKHPIATGLAQVGGSITSPGNLFTIAGTGGLGELGEAGAIVPRLISAGFGANTIYKAIRTYPDVRQAAERGDVSEVKRLLTIMATQSILGSLAFSHAATGRGAVSGRTGEIAAESEQPIAEQPAQPTEPSASASGPASLAEQAGLLHKGEVAPGAGVHQFEHPQYPGLTMAAHERELSTAKDLTARMYEKIADFRQNPSALVQSVLARGDAEQASQSQSNIPADVQARIDANTQALRDLADPEQINSTDDVAKVLQNASAKLSRNTDPRITAALSVPLRQALARELGLTDEQLFNTPIGRAENAETVEAARQLLSNSRTSVLASAQAARTDPAKLDDFLTTLARHNEISGVVRGQVAREAGRALQAFNEGPGTAQARTIDEAVRDLSAMPEDAKRQAAFRFAMLDPSEPGAMERFAREVKPASTADKLYEAWMNGILTSAAVPAKVAGDLSMQIMGIAAKPIAGALDMLRSAVTGSPRERFAGETLPYIYGQIVGTPAAIDRFARTFKNEVGSQDNEFEPPRIAIKGKTGRIVRIPTRLLAAVTDFYNAVNYNGELYAGAFRAATQEGLSGADRMARIRELAAHPTQDMQKSAAQFARTQTFQDNFQGEGWYNAAMREALRLKNNKLARWLFPFVRTPANIVRENVRFSPLGTVGAVKGAIAGDVRGGALSDLSAKNVLGTSIFLWALHKALGGQITGAGPTNPEKRRALTATGWQPYSVLKDGEYQSFRRMVPVNFALGAAADIADQIKANPNDPTLAGKIYTAITHTSKQVLDNPFLPTISDIANAMQSSKRAASFASYEVIPGFVRDTAHMLDRTVRTPQTAAQEFETNIPGLTSRVPARIDSSGQPEMRPVSSLGGFNPFPTSAAKGDPVLSELGRLGITSGNAPKKATAPARGTVKGSKRPSTTVSTDEAEHLERQDSQLFYNRLHSMMNAPRWNALNDAQRTAAIKRLRARIAATRYGRLQQMRTAASANQWRVVGETPTR